MNQYIRTTNKPGRPSKSAPKIPFTRSAYEAMLKKRAKFYKLKDEVMVRLKDAREMGDLSENGAYKYAKFELGNIGRELRKLNHLIEDGEVRNSEGSIDEIGFGSTITVDDGKKTTSFMLVSKHESDPAEQKLSVESPLGEAVNGRRVGDKVEVATPGGVKKYEVVEVG